MKKIILVGWLLSVLIGLTGCVDESLQVQTEFPFTLTNEPLPTPLPIKSEVSIHLNIRPERVTSWDAYTLRVLPGTIPSLSVKLDGQLLGMGVPIRLNRLIPRLDVTAPAAGSYTFTVEVQDRAGTRQTLPFTLQAQ